MSRKKPRRPSRPHFLINRDQQVLDSQVLTLVEFAALNAISIKTVRRILKSADAPATVRLTSKRIGITLAASKAWQARRAGVVAA
jgi:hypothetical protein